LARHLAVGNNACMNRWIMTAAFAVLLSGTGFSPAQAAERTTEALLACADEPDDPRRLRCFDAVVAGLRTAPASAAVPSAPAQVAAPETATPAASAEDRFGARGELKRETHGELSEISGTVTAVSTKPYGQLVVTLDNEQVWAEIAAGSKLKLKPGDRVKIERGALGSYVLITANGRSSKVARAR
jgi:hypothetical protein